MPESVVPTARPVLLVERLDQKFWSRLHALGLCASFWDPAGEPLTDVSCCGEFCEHFCGQRKLCREAMGRLAQQVCGDGASITTIGPTGCCILAVPVRHRRRLVGAAVAGFPSLQTPDSEEFIRACSQDHLDREAMANLCRKAARHDASQVELLCNVLEWLIEDEQGKAVAQKELTTLSTNLASTYEELSLLYRISGSMKVTHSGTEFFDSLCRDLLEVMHLQAAVVLLYPREHGGRSEQFVFAGDLPLTEGQLSRVVQRYLTPRLRGSKRAIVDNQFSVHAAHLGAEVDRLRSLIAVPLLSADKCKGVLLCINKLTGEFDSVDLKLIGSISSQAAVFLDNHHLYEDLQDLLMGLLHALTASIDAKDPYTCGHSRRVALISRKLAELSGFDEGRVGRVYLAGLLHDIGKIGVPESVLLKSGKLTDDEFRSIKRHPEIGAGILAGIPQMQDVVPTVLYHHERLDGRGYPKGLSGGAVPIEALMVGLADSVDAMTSRRTYRSVMPLEAVIVEIRRCSGTQFDTRLVELLLSLDLEEYLKQLRDVSAVDAEAGVRS